MAIQGTLVQRPWAQPLAGIATLLFAAASLALVAGCFGATAYGPATTNPGLPVVSQTPSHPPTTPAEWSKLDARAKEAAERAGGNVTTSFHALGAEMTAPSPCVMAINGMKTVCVARDVTVEANHCYIMAVAWGFAAKASVQVTFDKGVNQSLGSKNFEGDAGIASGTFCTDADGKATVHVMALGPERELLFNELLEYSVAVASRTETAIESAARRSSDAAKADAAAAQIENNIFMSESRQHGMAFARGCERCRKLDASQFEACAQSMGMDRFGRVQCHFPVR